MGFLRAICRFILGAVFVLSGLLKVIDPVGTSLKVREYLGAFSLDNFDFLSMLLGMMLSILEFIVGVAILKGIKFKLFSKISLILVSFFTILTLYLAIFNPIKDCGCFGEAIHLTNWQTFFKNLILFAIAIFLFFQRKNFEPIASNKVEWIYIGWYFLLVFFLMGYSLRHLPQIDFGLYKAGTNLINVVDGEQEKEYAATFVYEKDGKRENFDLNNLPDSTWTFVDSKTIQISGSTDKMELDFALKDSLGNYFEEKILAQENPIFVISYYNANVVDENRINKIKRLYDTLSNLDAKLYIISGNGVNKTKEAFKLLEEYVNNDIPIYFSDYKTLISLNRSNGGLIYIKEGVIVDKWSRRRYPFNNIRNIINMDPEIVTAENVIKENLFAWICLALIFLLIAILRFITKTIYKRIKRIEREKNS